MASPVRSVLRCQLRYFSCASCSLRARARAPAARPVPQSVRRGQQVRPITEFGPKISIEAVARGMTAPHKGWPGRACPTISSSSISREASWAVDLANPNTATNKTVFLDASALLVTLGVCGVGSFDERGLLGVAFHPDFNRAGTFGFRKFYTYTSEPRGGPPTIPSPSVPSGMADHKRGLRMAGGQPVESGAGYRPRPPRAPAHRLAAVQPRRRRPCLRARRQALHRDG